MDDKDKKIAEIEKEIEHLKEEAHKCFTKLMAIKHLITMSDAFCYDKLKEFIKSCNGCNVSE